MKRAAPVLFCLIAMSLFTCASTAGATARASAPLVDLAATPKGWIPVDYGDAQISVPPSWGVLHRAPECGHTEGLRDVVLIDPWPNHCLPPTPQQRPTNEVELVPRPSDSQSTKAEVVNGITLYGNGSPGSGDFVAPSLAVGVVYWGPLGSRILHTLTWSPRAVALETGSQTRVPASWQTVSFAGVSFSVPGPWQVRHTDVTTVLAQICSTQYVVTLNPSDVLLSTDRTPARILDCLRLPRAQAPVGGVQVDSGPQTLSRWNLGIAFTDKCLDLHGLRACPNANYQYSILLLKVTVPGRSTPVIVSIGLVGSGLEARAILNSLRPRPAIVLPGDGIGTVRFGESQKETIGLAGNGLTARTILDSLRKAS